MFFLVLLAACASTPTGWRAKQLGTPKIEPTNLASLCERFNFKREQIGYLVYDLDRRSIVAEHNAKESFIPASTQKVVTSAVALGVLGPDYRYRTTLTYTGKIESGTLRGDLYLKGTGDPFLTGSDLMDLVQAMVQRGIRVVSGNFYYDDTLLPNRPSVDPGQEADSAYNASVSALSTQFNRVALHWSPNLPLYTLDAAFSPPLPSLRLEFAPKPLYGGKSVAENTAGDLSWVISPDLRREGQAEVPVKNASRFTADFFNYLALSAGINIAPGKPGTAPAAAIPLAAHQSPPLTHLLQGLLEFSNNIVAELIFLSTAKKLGATALTPEEASRRVNHWLTTKVKTQWKGYLAPNGSGLTSQGRISPTQMVEILKFAEKSNRDEHHFISLLPIAGGKGTLKERMVSPQTAYRVWAKTGSLNYVSGLAGFLFSQSHRRYLFALFINDGEKRTLLDAAFGNETAESKRMTDEAEPWLRRARTFQDEIVSQWVVGG